MKLVLMFSNPGLVLPPKGSSISYGNCEGLAHDGGPSMISSSVSVMVSIMVCCCGVDGERPHGIGGVLTVGAVPVEGGVLGAVLLVGVDC